LGRYCGAPTKKKNSKSNKSKIYGMSELLYIYIIMYKDSSGSSVIHKLHPKICMDGD